MEPTPTTRENFFQDMLSASVAEARENGQIVSSPHEAYALLSERLDAFWHGVRLRREPEVLLDLLVALATQCVAAGDDLFVQQVIEENNREAK